MGRNSAWFLFNCIYIGSLTEPACIISHYMQQCVTHRHSPSFPLTPAACSIPPASSPTNPHPYRITGPLPSLFHLTRLPTHSTASLTPSPLNALTGKTRLSRTPPPLSPSNTLLTSPSLIRTVSTQSSRSCLFASTSSGIDAVLGCASTASSVCLHSSKRPTCALPRSPSSLPLI